MANGTRMYEVPVPVQQGAVEPRIYLVEATTPSAAENKVAKLFVGDAKIADAKRALELAKIAAQDGSKVVLMTEGV